MNRTSDDMPLFNLPQKPPIPAGPDVDLPAPHNKTSTSAAASRQIRPISGSKRMAVLRFITERADHGATDEEIQQALGMKVQTETPRRGELVKLKYVLNSGRTRPTTSGGSAFVWVAVDGGPTR
jgi:hypothetical protein